MTAALAGALAGIGTFLRTQTSVIPGTYSDLVANAGAYAQEVDTLLATVAPNVLQTQALQSLSEGYFAGKYPGYTAASSYQTIAQAVIAMLTQSGTWYAANVIGAIPTPGSGTTPASQIQKVRNVVITNVANLAAYTVAGAANDDITNIAGDTILLINQTVAAQNGPYIVGAVVGGLAPLTRPAWWTGTKDIGLTLFTILAGTSYAGSVWNSMTATMGGTFVVDADSPNLYPYSVTLPARLVDGVVALTAPYLSSDRSAILISRTYAGFTTHPPLPSITYTTMYDSDTSTNVVGPQGTVNIKACNDDGTVNPCDISGLTITVINNNNSPMP